MTTTMGTTIDSNGLLMIKQVNGREIKIEVYFSLGKGQCQRGVALSICPVATELTPRDDSSRYSLAPMYTRNGSAIADWSRRIMIHSNDLLRLWTNGDHAGIQQLINALR